MKILNSIYDLGKFWVKKRNIDKIDIILDSYELDKRIKKVLFLNITIDKNNNPRYEDIDYEEYSKYRSRDYLYKKPPSNGSGPSLSTIMAKSNLKNRFDKKFLSWFKKNKEYDKLIKKLCNLIHKEKDTILKDIEKCYEKIVDENDEEILLTLKFNENKSLNDYSDCDHNIFKELLLKKATEKSYKSKKEKSIGESACYLCNKQKQVYGLVLSYVGLKFGTTDKPGNTPEFSLTNQWKQAGICEDCVLYLEAGKKFIEKYLRFSEFGLTYYVIPTFFFNKKEVFNEIYEDLLEIDNTQGYFNIAPNIEKSIKEDVEELNDTFELKFLYFQENQNEFRITGYTSSILPSHLHKIYKAQQKISNLPLFNEENMKKIFGNKIEGNFLKIVKNEEKKEGKNKKKKKEGKNKKISLNLYNWYLSFLRDFISFNENKYYIDIVSSIMTSYNINYNFLLKKIIYQIRLDWVNSSEKEQLKRLKINIFKSLHLILLFNDLKVTGGKTMGIKNVRTPEEILESLDDPSEKVCFLLGVLTRKVTLIQNSKLRSTPFIKKLGDLNFDYDKLVNLYKKVFIKLSEYNSLDNFTEKGTSFNLENIEKELSLNFLNIKNNGWNLTKDETSLYFIIGYTMGEEFELKENKLEGSENYE